MEALTDYFLAVSSPKDFDLSRNKSLRAIETTMLSFEVSLNLGPPFARASILRHALSTITSPVFAEVIVLFRNGDFPSMDYCLCGPPAICPLLEPYSTEVVSNRRKLFEVLREMHEIRNFKPVLCADVWGYLVERAVRQLKRAAAYHWARREPDSLSPLPQVTFSPRGFLPVPGEQWDHKVEDARWIRAWAPQN